MSILTLKVINTSLHPLPEYATEHAAGLDLKANLKDPIVLKPLQRQLIQQVYFLNCRLVMKHKSVHEAV